jgi:SAM-dependent methyltransferase
LREDFENISKYLPQNATRVLDIGSGLGGINALTYDALKTKPEIWLLDKEGVSKDWNAGYHKSASTFSHYNSFDAGGQMLTGAGIPKAKINFVNISEQPFPDNKTFDIVYSFISWGFHYPLETYSEQVKKSLSEDGVLIVDTRRGTTDVEKVSVIFDRPAKIILEGSHVQRFLIGKSARN